MKKLLFLLMFSLIFSFPMTVSADLDKTITGDFMTISSQHRCYIDENNKEYYLWVYFYRNNSNAEKGTHLMLSSHNPNAFYTPRMLFSFKNAIQFEIVSKTPAKKQVVYPSTIYSLSTGKAFGSMTFTLGKDFFTLFNNANEITFLIPTDTGEKLRIKLPDEILKEWKYVMTCNFREALEIETVKK